MTHEAKANADRPFRLVGGLANDRPSGRVYVFSDGSVRLAVELGLVSGTWQPVGFEVRAHVDRDGRDEPLTARQLRGIHFGALVDAARTELKKENEAVLAAEGPVLRVDEVGRHRMSIPASAAQKGLEQLRAPRPGRPRLTDEEIQQDAAVYRDIARTSRQPTKDLAEKLQLSRSAAAKRVQRARALGLLPKTRRGIPKS